MPRAAFITGGAKRIGAAIARALVADGYPVVLHFNRSQAEAENLCRDVHAQGGQAALVQGDLADLDGLAALYSRACAPFGPPGLLINNASVFAPDRIETLESGLFSEQLATNLQAPLLLSRAFAAALPEGEAGAIINIIDQRVLRPDPDYFSYAISKAALHHATKMLAQALAPRIRVNAIGPGPVLPNVHEGDQAFQQEAAATLLQRPVPVEEIARTAVFLAQAPNITGQMLAVDSGQHLS